MTRIEQNVMGAVGVVYLTRQLMSATALKVYVFVASVWSLGQLVWVARVFENFSAVGASGAAQFIAAALLNTDTLVQFALLVGTFTLLSLLFDFVRSFSPQKRLAF